MSNKDEVNSKAEDSPLRSESVLERFGAEFTVIDLDWSPEEESDWSPEDEEENEDAEAEDEEELELQKGQLLKTLEIVARGCRTLGTHGAFPPTDTLCKQFENASDLRQLLKIVYRKGLVTRASHSSPTAEGLPTYLSA